MDIEPSPGQEIPNNLSLYTFNIQEASFLAGYLAAGMSSTGKIGFIGGMRNPEIIKFEAGYKAGAKIYNQFNNASVEVITSYCESFSDPAKAKQMALSQFDAGTDIIFTAAGASGNGVIDATREKGSSFYGIDSKASLKEVIDSYYEKGRGYFAVGVDVDQDYLAPGFILSSVLKRVDVASFDSIEQALSPRYFQSGHHILGMSENGVGLSQMKYTKGMVPNQLIAELFQLENFLSQGLFKVPSNLEELNDFELDESLLTP